MSTKTMDKPDPEVCGFCCRPIRDGDEVATEARPTRNGADEIWYMHRDCFEAQERSRVVNPLTNVQRRPESKPARTSSRSFLFVP